MLRALAITLLLGTSACDKGEPPRPKEATLTSGKVGADGVRRIEVEAGKEGYRPSRIAARPGEKLLLVFKRTVDGECFAELKTPDGKLVALPKNAPVEVPVTVPSSGEITFACGMDMYKGVIVAEPAG